jgi:hypothetical protein
VQSFAIHFHLKVKKKSLYTKNRTKLFGESFFILYF